MTVWVLPWWDNLMKDNENIIITDFVLQKYNCFVNLKIQKQQEHKKISEFLLHEQ